MPRFTSTSALNDEGILGILGMLRKTAANNWDLQYWHPKNQTGAFSWLVTYWVSIKTIYETNDGNPSGSWVSRHLQLAGETGLGLDEAFNEQEWLSCMEAVLQAAGWKKKGV